MVQNLPEGTEWQAMAIERHQLPLTTIARLSAGHVRVGMEDHVYYHNGELAGGHAQLVERAAHLADP